MQTIGGKHYIFAKENQPTATAKVGEELLFKTIDCFGCQIKSENDLIDKIDLNLCNPTAGPVYIEGAEVGDVLVVDILDIKVDKVGFACSIPEAGALSHLAEARTRMFAVEDGMVKFNDISWPLNPMVGVIGVAPKSEGVISGDAGRHGGNMDNKLITKGSRVYLPVGTPGALLQMGDIHATMGNGEISMTGIEINGEILVKTSLIKGFELNWPVNETEDMYYVNTISMTGDFVEAQQLACEELARLLVNTYGWDMTDVFIYLSVQGSVEINASILPCHDGIITLRVGAPKVEGKALIQ